MKSTRKMGSGLVFVGCVIGVVSLGFHQPADWTVKQFMAAGAAYAAFTLVLSGSTIFAIAQRRANRQAKFEQTFTARVGSPISRT